MNKEFFESYQGNLSLCDPRVAVVVELESSDETKSAAAKDSLSIECDCFAAQYSGSSSIPPTIDMLSLAKVNEAGAESIRVLRAQLASLQKNLKHVQGVADIATSKCKLAAEREDYLVQELIKSAKDLVCKYKPSSHVCNPSSSDKIILAIKLNPCSY